MFSRHDIEIPGHQVVSVIKKDMGMRYRKINAISVHTNSNKNLVLRQQFALKLITLMHQGKRILNVDQSWLVMTDFRRRKWRPRESNNFVTKAQVTTRISLFLALDTEEQV